MKYKSLKFFIAFFLFSAGNCGKAFAVGSGDFNDLAHFMQQHRKVSVTLIVVLVLFLFELVNLILLIKKLKKINKKNEEYCHSLDLLFAFHSICISISMSVPQFFSYLSAFFLR